MNKDAIRKEILSLRNNMDARMVLEYSSIIQNRLMELDLYKESRVIFTYMSFKNEVETRDLICQALKKNKRVVIPVCRKADRSIIPSEIFDLNQLEENFYGILEPTSNNMLPIKPEAIDLAVVPGLAFDNGLNRIGHGAGYYDRFLPRLNKNSPKIALAYSIQILPVVPVERYDIPVDMIITEKGIIKS